MGKTTRLVVGGLLGMAAGAARGYVDSALEEQRARIAAQRDEQLSRLRREENVASLEARTAIDNRERAAAQGRMSTFYDQNAPGNVDANLVKTDDEGNAMPPATRAETRRETAERQHQAAQRSGDKDIIAQTYTELRDVKNDEKGSRDERRLDIMEKFQERQAERQETLAQATLAHQKRMAEIAKGQSEAADKRAEAATVAAQRQATALALKGVSDDIKSLEKEGADAVGTPKQKVIESQIATLRAEGERYRKALAAGGLQTPETAASAPTGDDPLGIRTKKEAPKPAEGATAAPASSAARELAPTGGLLEQALPGQQTYGPMTSEETLQRDAKAGVPAAIEYLRKREAARLAEIEARARREAAGATGLLSAEMQ